MINIIGNGLAGSILARTLRAAGHECRVVSDNWTQSGSGSSSNLYIAHWLKKFSAQGRAGLEALEDLKLETDNPFETGLSYAAKVRHIAQRHILVEPDEVGRVENWLKSGCLALNGEPLEGTTVLCLGAREATFRAGSYQEPPALVGHCLFIPGTLGRTKSRLALVSPYVHEKLYQWDAETVYYADSVAVKPEAYVERKDELQARTLERCERLLGKGVKGTFRTGWRPLTPGQPFGKLERISEHVWSINGGGKSGMVAYALRAREFLGAIS